MPTSNDYRMNNISVVIRLVSLLQLLQLPTILVESLSIQSHTLPSSPFSTIKSWPLPVTTCSSSASPSDRISILRTTTRSRSALFSPLYTSSDDTIETSNKKNETSNHDSKIPTNIDAEAEASGDGGILPSYKQLIIFTATTILIWLSEPLLSLVDTTIVGLTASAKSSVIQIAALGPATTLFDSLIYTTYFLAISTTNQLAPRLAVAASSASSMSKSGSKPNGEVAENNTDNPWKELRQSTSHLLGLAIVFGSLVSTITFAFGKPIIGGMVGGATSMGAAEANSVISLANNYARIRAAVAPFSILGFVAQSFCLTTLDVTTPAIAVAAASIVNIIGDLVLSPRYGIQGAAIATAMATVTSCSILLRKVRNTTNKWKAKQAELEKATSTTKEEKTNSIDRDIPFVSIPDKSSLIDLFKLAGPIFFVMMSKVACYNLMTVRATTFGIIPLASHNIMMRVFFFFASFGDSLSQAAQSFYPQVNKKARGKLIKRLFCIASFIGLSNNELSRRILSSLGRFLTKDPNIIETMATYSPWVGFAVLLHPFIMLLEGTLLAKRDLIFMIGSYAATSLLHFSFVFSPVSSTFAGLWRALFGFQLIRLVQFAARVWQQPRATRKNGPVQQEGMPAPPL